MAAAPNKMEKAMSVNNNTVTRDAWRKMNKQNTASWVLRKTDGAKITFCIYGMMLRSGFAIADNKEI